MIRLENINKLYEGDTYKIQALQDITLTIGEGEFVSIMGRSGSGKTTLLNIIGFLDTATSGTFLFGGKDVSHISSKNLWRYRRENIGFVFQNFALIDHNTVLENVILPLQAMNVSRREAVKKADHLLDRMGIAEMKHKYPSQISGGQKQRVAIARALVADPKIILADEPTGAVDTKTSSNIQDLFRKLNRELGLTIIIVTHDMKLAHKVDRVVMISDGKISTEKILKQHYRDMLDQLESPDMTDETHEEYSVLDKAHRVQLSDDMLAAAGIDTNKVKVRIEDGRVVIEAEEKKE